MYVCMYMYEQTDRRMDRNGKVISRLDATRRLTRYKMYAYLLGTFQRTRLWKIKTCCQPECALSGEPPPASHDNNNNNNRQ